jgi:hypothetical protein
VGNGIRRKLAKFDETVKKIGPLPATNLIADLYEIFGHKTFNEPLAECGTETGHRFRKARRQPRSGFPDLFP